MDVYRTDRIRNVVLLGHGGSGKTTLAEAMAYLAGMTNRLGRVEDGNTVSDFDKEEIKRHFSISTTLIPVPWDKVKINVLDTPGYFDFVGEVEEAVSAADAAIIVVSGKAGVQVGTQKAWNLCEKYKLPRMFFVTDMDVDDVSYRKVVEELTELYGKKIAPLHFPIRENGKFVGYVNVVKQAGRKYIDKAGKEPCDIPEYLNEYLEKFDLPGKCIMDETGLKEAGYDVLKSMKQENVCYAEIRFAPLLSETPDMNCNKVIEALLAGLEKGKRDFGVEYGVITCAMRHHSEEENARMLRTAREYLGHGVCAADLAGAESLYPMSEFMELFKKTKALGMPFTLHAGECGNVQNILDSVEAGAGRIGHGIAMRGHADVQKELQKKGIGIEMCPISNLQTKAVGSTKDYPMREFLNARLKVTVNTDNRTVSNTTLTKELEFIQKTYGITDEEIHLMMRNAVDVAFADDAVKERMLKYV